MVLPLPAPGRTNTTALLDNHPSDHNTLVDAINEVNADLQDALLSANYRVYNTLADRNADVTAHIEGMLAWSISERTLSIWHGEWTVIFEPFIAFTPHLWIGSTEFRNVTPTSGTAYQSGYRHEFGKCAFYIAARFGQLGPSETGVLSVMPPLRPTNTGSGPAGSGYAVVPDLGAVGGMSVGFNGTTSLPAPSDGTPLVQGQLAIVMPGTGGLLDRADMGSGSGSIGGGNPGEFDVFLSGFYPLYGFVV